jgi:uncharacterized protein YukE
MATKQDIIEVEITLLVEQGRSMLGDLAAEANGGEVSRRFRREYESWYTQARRVVAQLIPERLDDLTTQYRFTGVRRELNYDTYRIVDFLHGTQVLRLGEPVFDNGGRAFQQFQIQVQIVQSSLKRLTTSLMDIRDVLAADLFDNELDKARALHKNKLLREAGVVAGVVLEAHLQNVASAHNVKIAKKAPTIGDLNDPLKKAEIFDTPTWRLIQRLADIRNLCDHKKEREPTPDEVLELIDGTDKITKTVF